MFTVISLSAAGADTENVGRLLSLFTIVRSIDTFKTQSINTCL